MKHLPRLRASRARPSRGSDRLPETRSASAAATLPVAMVEDNRGDVIEDIDKVPLRDHRSGGPAHVRDTRAPSSPSHRLARPW